MADLLKLPARGSNRPGAGTPEFFGVRSDFSGLWPVYCRPDGRDVWYCGLCPESSSASLSYSILRCTKALPLECGAASQSCSGLQAATCLPLHFPATRLQTGQTAPISILYLPLLEPKSS